METEQKHKRNYLVWLLLPVLFFLGLILGWRHAIPTPAILAGQNGVAVREADTAYKLINPLIECEPGDNSFTELKPIKDKISSYVDQVDVANNHIDFVSLYFRDLNNGPWFGINDNATFSPASLLKIPIMISYFKQAEANPDILKKAFVFHNGSLSSSIQQTILPSQSLEDGQSYTVDDLITRMIVYSDNRALSLLTQNIDTATYVQVFNDFGLILPNTNQPESYVSVKTYSGFFRVLFNASYLGREYSEKALDLLSRSEFKDGLVAGVPANVTVSHKFGERGETGNPEIQFHDCGIIYYPNHPYLLCVMSRGNRMQDLEDIVKGVSNYVYNEVDSQFNDNVK